MKRKNARRRFIVRWTVATIIAGLIAVVFAFILGMVYGALLLPVDTLPLVRLLWDTLWFGLVGGAIGIVLGIGQGQVLKLELVPSWRMTTALGWAVGAAVACVITSIWVQILEVIQPSPLIRFLWMPLCIGVLGLIIGGFQWWALRRWVMNAHWWIMFKSIGYSAVSVIIYVLFYTLITPVFERGDIDTFWFLVVLIFGEFFLVLVLVETLSGRFFPLNLYRHVDSDRTEATTINEAA